MSRGAIFGHFTRLGGAYALAFVGVAACHGDPPLPPQKVPDDQPIPTATTTASPSTAPLLVYREDGARLSFWEMGAVRIVVDAPSGPRTCDGQLGENGNAWTRSDLLAAFENVDVKAALKRSELYKSSYPAPAVVEAGKDRIAWVIAWKELPPPEPEAVRHFHEVLHVITTNRRSLCS